jgi:hypothetical protein
MEFTAWIDRAGCVLRPVNDLLVKGRSAQDGIPRRSAAYGWEKRWLLGTQDAKLTDSVRI